MRFFHCSWALIALLAAPVLAQAPAAPTTTHSYVIFVRGVPVGREDVSVTLDPNGTTILSEGRNTVPVETILQRVELRYNSKGAPESAMVDGLVAGSALLVRMNFIDGSAIIRTLVDGKSDSTTQSISQDALVVPRGVFASFAALAQRLQGTRDAGTEFRLFLVQAGGEVRARLVAIRDEQMQTGAAFFNVRRYDLAVPDIRGETLLSLTTAADGSLLAIAIPAQAINVLRSDIAGANTRTTVYTNPGDHLATVPSLGFNLGATITLPAGRTAPESAPSPAPRPERTAPSGPSTRAGAVVRTEPLAPAPAAPTRLPAVILVAGKDSPDRDAISAGAPAMSNLAGALAGAGFIAVRYDQRGVGQSGGRTESAAIGDYAEDARAVAKWLSDRKDVDPKRIAIVGHGEGAWIALQAASSDKRIGAVVTLAAPASKGDQFVLEQQSAQLDALAVTGSERAGKEALQKQLHIAILTGKGWEQFPPELRRRADTPWFHSLLSFDPGKVISGIKAPLLIVHGEVDQEIPSSNAERLAETARKGKSDSVELAIVPGVNHQLVPAFTGSVREYPAVVGRGLSPDVSSAVVAWLTKTLPEPRR